MANPNNLKKTAPIMVTIGIVVLIGIAIIASLSDTLKDPTGISNEALTSVLIGTDEALAQNELTANSVTVTNATDVTDILVEDTDYSIEYDQGVLSLLTTQYNNTDINVSYTYLADSTESLAADTFSNGLIIFGTFMSIIVLALVGKFVIALFGKV